MQRTAASVHGSLVHHAKEHTLGKRLPSPTLTTQPSIQRSGSASQATSETRCRSTAHSPYCTLRHCSTRTLTSSPAPAARPEQAMLLARPGSGLQPGLRPHTTQQRWHHLKHTRSTSCIMHTQIHTQHNAILHSLRSLCSMMPRPALDSTWTASSTSGRDATF